jgi:raffinose/stachyose/melibiose transport system permease protein
MERKLRIWRYRNAYLFVLPTFILLCIFNYYPAFSGLYRSLFDWAVGGQAKFIGFKNFIEILTDKNFQISVVNVIKLTIWNVLVPSLIIPILVAEMIFNLHSPKAKYIYRVLVISPMVIPSIVILLIWQFIYDADYGLLNAILKNIGLGYLARSWLGDPNTALYAIMAIGFPWIGGTTVLIYLAGLMNIPNSIFDAALLDGVIGLKRFFNIDLPLITGQIKLCVILSLIGTIQGYGTMLVLTGGGPGVATLVPGLYMYQAAFNFGRMGFASAVGVILFLVILWLTILNMKYISSPAEYEAQ